MFVKDIEIDIYSPLTLQIVGDFDYVNKKCSYFPINDYMECEVAKMTIYEKSVSVFLKK